ncbi:MAG: chemotaxis protein CheD [Magnetococcales bacterium]|nr:chemotaxis protein CheD [Magnetococcales bacterium]
MEIIRLDPGELYVSTSAVEVHTILGSCVSVTLFHPRLRQGAICHGRKPSHECVGARAGLKICRELGDHVRCSLEFMLAWFDQKGVVRHELEVKLFGGGMMFSTEAALAATPLLNMGKRNIDTAMEFIRTRHLHLTASDVGGPWARQIVFQTDTGEVKLKRIRKSAQELARLETLSGGTV